MFTGLAGAPRSLTAHQFALTTLRKAIMAGEIPGGTRLAQAAIAAELNISTTPVREALRDLAKEGLIIFDPHRGALVRTLDLKEVREIYEMRRALEPLLVPRALQSLDDAAFARAENLLQEMDETTDPAQFVVLNQQFHGVFHETISGSRLGDALASLSAASELYVYLSLKQEPERMREANEEHRALLKSFRDRDAAAAKRLTKKHLASTLSLIESAQLDEVAK